MNKLIKKPLAWAAIMVAMLPVAMVGALNRDQLEEAIYLIDQDISRASVYEPALLESYLGLKLQLLRELSYYGGNENIGGGSSSNNDDEAEVDTLSARDIDGDEAELRGEVDLNDWDDIYYWFEYGRDDDDLDDDTPKRSKDEDGTFSYDIDDLNEDKKYYYRAVVQNRDTNEKEYGKIRSFTADGSNSSDDVEVETKDAEDIDGDEATLVGEITEGDDVDVWFALDTNSGVSCSSSADEEGVSRDYDEDDEFELTVDNLDEGEKYYYRACAEDEDGDEVSGDIETFTADDDNNSNDDEPEAEIDDAYDVEDDSAEIRGEVDMNDFQSGIVFFVWGEDEDQVEDIEDDYEEYDDVDEDGDDLQKQRVDSDLDGQDDYRLDIDDLDDNTDHFFSICVEFENDDDDQEIICSKVEEFETD